MHGAVALWLALCSTGVILDGSPLTFDEAAREAEAIVACHVVKVTPRWGDASKTWMETEYTIEVDDTPAATELVKRGARLSIVAWGGTIGDETQGIADLPQMALDKSYVLMLRPGWKKADEFSPVVGFCQGFFPVVADDQSDRRIVVDYSGRPVYAVASGARLALSAESQNSADSRKRVTPEQFMEILRGDMRRIQALPARAQPARAARDSDAPQLPRKKPAPRRTANAELESIKTVAPRAPAVKGLIEPAEPAKPTFDKGSGDERAIKGHRHESDVVKGFAKYVTVGRVRAPVVINQFTSDMTPWSPVDEECLAIWNHYADVVLVRQTPSVDAGWRDNVFDLHGWMDESDLFAMFGSRWPAGAIAICPMLISNGTIIEADIAFNEAYGWTLAEESILNGTNGASKAFRATLIHESGHLLGLDHVQEHAIMFPESVKYFDSELRPSMDDAEGLRALYPSKAQQITDLGIYLFALKNGKWSDLTMPASVARGAQLTINDYTVENVGTRDVAAANVEFYLCSQRNFNGAFHYIGTGSFGSLEVFTMFEPSAMTRNLTVPTSVPPGSYYLGAFIRDDQSYDHGTFPFRNSMAFSRKKISVN